MGFFSHERRERSRANTIATAQVSISQQAYPMYVGHPGYSQTVPANTGYITSHSAKHTQSRTDLSSTSLPTPPIWDQPVAPELWVTPTSYNNRPMYHDTTKHAQDDADQEAVDKRLTQLFTLIDEGAYKETEQDLIIDLPLQESSRDDLITSTRSLEKSLVRFDLSNTKVSNRNAAQSSRYPNRSINILSKVSYYSNSRLPPNLPPLRVYIPTWPLLCLAAQYSSSAYDQPTSMVEQATHIAANPRLGTKAMVVKGVCFDDRKIIVFAIRGTSVFSLKDWNVNLSHKPSSPAGFLDDDGNLCHSGFLKVAKAMVQPIAARLRSLLEQNPSRAACSLVITGHSAGGAVASLIYSHMLSERVQSDLTILTSCFKRVHCVTFGSPPVSLLPLSKPESKSKKSLFHSFINEGDPVVRAEPVFVRSLVDLLTTPVPSIRRPSTKPTDLLCASLSKLDLNILPSTCAASNQLRKQRFKPSNNSTYSLISPTSIPPTTTSPPPPPRWQLPSSTLSNAGRLVILRVPPLLSPLNSTSPNSSSTSNMGLKHEFENITASIASDEQIRQVVFGNPPMHAMEVYRRRIEALSFKAVTGREGVWGI